jgi:hypothetical protein
LRERERRKKAKEEWTAKRAKQPGEARGEGSVPSRSGWAQPSSRADDEQGGMCNRQSAYDDASPAHKVAGAGKRDRVGEEREGKGVEGGKGSKDGAIGRSKGEGKHWVEEGAGVGDVGGEGGAVTLGSLVEVRLDDDTKALAVVSEVPWRLRGIGGKGDGDTGDSGMESKYEVTFMDDEGRLALRDRLDLSLPNEFVEVVSAFSPMHMYILFAVPHFLVLTFFSWPESPYSRRSPRKQVVYPSDPIYMRVLPPGWIPVPLEEGMCFVGPQVIEPPTPYYSNPLPIAIRARTEPTNPRFPLQTLGSLNRCVLWMRFGRGSFVRQLRRSCSVAKTPRRASPPRCLALDFHVPMCLGIQ